GSRLISGNYSQIQELEQQLATFFDGEGALVFNSGFDANIGLLSSLPQKHDLILYDEHIHASVRDGIRLSNAKNHSFKHNDVADLEDKLSRLNPAGGVAFVCVETLYSMGGDFCPLLSIIEVCEKYNAYLIVDEAHAGGLYGSNGEGFAMAVNLHQRIFARVYTFGKAFGCHGAVIVGSDLLKQFLINFARSFIYTTAIAPYTVHHITQNIRRTDLDACRFKLFENISYFRKKLDEYELFSHSEINSPIQMLKVQDASQAHELATLLKQQDILVKAIVPPTVKSGDESIRVCLHAFNTKQEIDELLDITATVLIKG
ncbi:MAG TPA: pyridoxal phosphate-dependent aminotransferase family protein, partial [Taishania sp.]|nr:pyridoxal phosphate-dependent aminotransferase family protein [Taishania sp.]